MDSEAVSLQMHLLQENELSSLSSQASVYKLLLDSLKAKDFRTFKNIFDGALKRQPPTVNVNYADLNRKGETFLDLACKNGLTDFVRYLLEKGAQPNRVHRRAPIHFATEGGHTEVLKVLLEDPTINPNLQGDQQTALHFAVKKNNLECAELLLDSGASPNIPDHRGQTALHIAASRGYENMVNLIRKKTRQSLDLDTYRDCNDETTREVLQRNFPQIPLPEPHLGKTVNAHVLHYFLSINDQENFLKNLKPTEDKDLYEKLGELIELATERNFGTVVDELLQRAKGIDCSLRKAAEIAVYHGRSEILRKLLDADDEIRNDLVLKACEALYWKRGTNDMENRLECLKIILEKDVNVRCTDGKGSTPLYYAAVAECREAVSMLLDKGSFIGHMNKCGVPPLAYIPEDVLSQYFDDCLENRKEAPNKDVIEFNYRCLMPHNVGFRDEGEKDEEDLPNQREPEMETLQYIAGNSNLKQLLKHPLLSSFLYLKWRKIRHVFYANFTFYVIFYLLINSYILCTIYNTNYDGKASEKNANNETVETVETSLYKGKFLWFLTAIALFFLIVREVLQLISSPGQYIKSLENWLELILIILGLTILNEVDRQVGAVMILLSAWELVILIGQHPRMLTLTGVEMFKKVSLNFMRFLFLYAFLILAFALAFFTLFKDSGEENFPDPGHSLFKTIIMLTGEFDANDIPFVAQPVISHFVFILFVFLIAIVLFNLLNGLAVNDTAYIIEKAELVGLISRTQLLSYVENIVLGTPISRKSQCCQGFERKWKWSPLAFFARRTLLFPEDLKDGKLSIRSQDDNDTPNVNKCCFECVGRNIGYLNPNMDPSILKQAKNILSRKNRFSDSKKIMDELYNVKDRLATIENLLNYVKRAVENNNFNVPTTQQSC